MISKKMRDRKKAEFSKEDKKMIKKLKSLTNKRKTVAKRKKVKVRARGTK